MKHVRKFLLLASFCQAMLSSALADAVPFTYTTNSGAITINRYTGPGGTVAIPDTIDNYPVTAIGFIAFYACTDLTKVVIPDSVTTIGLNAFYGCTGLTNVVIGGGVTTIGFEAFQNCTSLTHIVVSAENPNYASQGGVLFDKTLTMLLQYPGSLVGSYVIPDSVTTIGDCAFRECTGLTNVVIPDSVTSIGLEAFSYCSGLTNAVIGSGVTSIGVGAFGLCSGLTELVIPDNVATIGSYAFVECTNMTNVVIGSGVTTIGENAFSLCSGLTNVVIGSGVTSIGRYAFKDCSSLQKVYFQGNAPTAPDNVFYGVTAGMVYYLAGTTGWDSSFGGWPTALFIPPPRIPVEGMGMQPDGNGFGFNISYSGGSMVVVEASTNLLDWAPVSTNLLDGGTGSFSDPSSTNHPSRYYRVLVP